MNHSEAQAIVAIDESVRTDPIDLALLRDRIGDDPDFEREVLVMFIDEEASRIGQMRDALERTDASPIAASSHGLKGCAGNVAAPRVIELARQIEGSARAGNLTAVAEALADLEAEHQRIMQFVAANISVPSNHAPTDLAEPAADSGIGSSR